MIYQRQIIISIFFSFMSSQLISLTCYYRSSLRNLVANFHLFLSSFLSLFIIELVLEHWVLV